MDEEFPDLDEPINAGSLAQAKHSADWAAQFGPGASNLMLRKKHKTDAANYVEMSNMARAQQMRQAVATDKRAQDLWAGEKQLNMDMERHNADMRMREQTFNESEQMLPLEIAAKQAATAASIAQRKATTEGAQFQADALTAKKDATTAFIAQVRKSGFRAGTPEYAQAMVEAFLDNPGTEKDFFGVAWKTTDSELDGDEALKRHRAALEAGGPNVTVTTQLPGGVTMTDRPQPDTSAKDAAARLSRLESLSTRTNLDDEQRAYFKSEIAKIKSGGNFANGAIKDAAAAPQKVVTADDYNKIPSGAEFIDPNGRKRRKP